MTTTEAKQLLLDTHAEIKHIVTATAVMHWDENAEPYPPEQGAAARGAAQGYLYEKAFGLSISPQIKEALDLLTADPSGLDEYERDMVKIWKKSYDKNFKVPPAEIAALESVVSQAMQAWMKAKQSNDFDTMLPWYDKIFEFQHKMADYIGYNKHPYDALLDKFEEGMTVELCDAFFAQLREELVPLLAAVQASGRQPDDSFLRQACDTATQAALNHEVAEWMGLDFNRLQMGTTEHPFMLVIGRDDIRMTTHYYEDDLMSALFSTLHEGGHALYELNLPQALSPYGLDEAASTAFHESQSRTFENVFGRSRQLMPHLLEKLKKHFPQQFADVTSEQLYAAVNIAQPSLIRVEADELTYCLHIMLRYEMEKDIMERKLTAADLPRVWNEKMQAYFGITPPDDKSGCLQDTHWSSGLFGYFPSYALGNAFSAQLVAKMRESVDVDDCLARGDFAPLTAWLAQHVHVHGCRLTPSELIVAATGEPLNAKYYVDYLKQKFIAVYGL